MTDLVTIPVNAPMLIVWDPNMSNGPYSTQWDGVFVIWDGGATKWDGGATVWGFPKTTWIS